MKQIKTGFQLFIIIICLCIQGCKKFLDIPAPSTSINENNVYKSDYTASAVLTGIYSQMMNEFTSGGITSISLLQELASDNIVLNNLTLTGYMNWWRNSLTADYFDTAGYGNYFSNFYPKIYIINAAIEGLENSSSISEEVKQRLLGEAYFLRAFYYFYLVNLYGDIPLVLSTDYTVNALMPRISSNRVYDQIEKDLNKSIGLLDDNYVDATIIKTTTERVRPNLSTALALLARTQLYRKEYSLSEAISTKIINKSYTYSLIGLDSVFKKNSRETIWALQPVKQGYNTDEAAVFILTRIPGIQSPKHSYLSNSLMSSFNKDDQRASKWIGTFTSGSIIYPFAAKYKVDANTNSVTEYCIVFRLAEQYLIRAEARAELNNIEGALSDLNAIRLRAGLQAIYPLTINEVKQAIQLERRSEFFAEWGHRWFDLKRTNQLDAAMQAAMEFKHGTWSSYKSVYPIPNSEILRDVNLTQNQGY